MSSKSGAVSDPELFRPIVLLYWLHHVAANLERSVSYATNRRWINGTVHPILQLV